MRSSPIHLISTRLLCLVSLFYTSLPAVEDEKDDLIARGEHRIEVQNFGHKRPEVPMDIMQSNYYNAHHPEYVIRIEDLNKTLNKEINEDISREYNEWFNAEFDRRQAEYEYYNNSDNDYNSGGYYNPSDQGSSQQNKSTE